MRILSTTMTYAYNSSFLRYSFAGGTTFMLDFLGLYVLHGRLHVGLALATTASYWFSIGYNFLINRYWAFSNAQKSSLSKHALYYAGLLGANFLIGLFLVTVLSRFMNYGAAKAVAVLLQISWTYPIYKNVIFALA